MVWLDRARPQTKKQLYYICNTICSWRLHLSPFTIAPNSALCHPFLQPYLSSHSPSTFPNSATFPKKCNISAWRPPPRRRRKERVPAMRLTWTTDAAQEAGTLPFVNVASDGRYSDHTRSLIRSHVMLGKNRGRRNRQKGHAKGSTNASAVPVSDAGRSAPSNRSVREPEEEAMWVRVPPKMGSDAYFSEFPTEVGLELLDSVRTRTSYQPTV
ncbi:hypothetical protein BU23DRAFT_114952 [Bimuria novae-zelandiae CBS 107.79]|uniref:Uncharacterized protein n=1 Tax=Bimuria novae-zelandiae CBS 107.79 TaxID=1447943 RepID=A0A6A5VH12_9PLEO|nr:hypothetical protein BU23DRAFT_114952 [Bimuria novae-zelandiae CBS 107.79]